MVLCGNMADETMRTAVVSGSSAGRSCRSDCCTWPATLAGAGNRFRPDARPAYDAKMTTDPGDGPFVFLAHRDMKGAPRMSDESQESLQREVLPIPDAPYNGPVYYDANDPATVFPPITEIRPPKGAPNVLVVLIDDVGFGASSAFGGPIHTPTAERLAANGLKYTRFHTTALCSPTRAALLTGRNHHSVGMGAITELATSAPGYTSMLPNTKAPVAKTLRDNGYSTAQFGKCHEVPVWETSPLGPFNHWPTMQGFEKFYGFIGGETNQWFPEVFDNLTRVEVPSDRSYHFTEDMTQKAIDWIKAQKAIYPDKPFFIYWAPGATHAPHQVAEEWIEKYKGTFDDGWDVQRERTFARQKELGVIPADAELTSRPEQIPAWDAMPEALKPVLRRQMETYAGFLEHTDHCLGQVIDLLEQGEMLGDTLIYYIIGDNGASAEGTHNGTFNEMINFNGAAALETPEYLLANLDKWGGRDSYPHYAVGWAHAMDTPYQWTKQVASHWGGTRTGAIVHWPNGIQARNEIRSQFCHVIDVAPTILEAAGIAAPAYVDGVEQAPLEGVSMRYSFNDGNADDQHTMQYFEIFGNRGIYDHGWTASTRHSIPWQLAAQPTPFDDDVWELYDTNSDWTQAHDLAAEMPDKLGELQRQFMIEAARYKVLPLDDRLMPRIIPAIAGRPTLIKGDTQVLFTGMAMGENNVVDIKNKSYAVTSNVIIPESGAEGVIIAQGANFGGWAIYAHEGRLKYIYNFLGLELYQVEANDPLPAGDHQVRLEFAYDGGGLGKGGTATLYVDGQQVAEGRVEHTHAAVFSADSTALVGNKFGAAIGPDLKIEGNAFNGTIKGVQIDLKLTDEDHFVSDSERWRIAMAIQ
jgi:arylsulfatase